MTHHPRDSSVPETAGAEHPLKVAIMSFAHTHAAGYVQLLQRMPGVQVRASDPGPHEPGEIRGRELADHLFVDYADSTAELLAWGPDAVIVTSENAHHRRDVELAAQAGAHILCEKPLATTLDDGEAMLAATEAAGVMLMVAFPVRFSSPFIRLKEAHDNGSLGQVLSVRGSNNGKLPEERAWFTDPALSGGGALVDHVVHIADLLDALLQAAPTAVTAVTNSTLHSDRARAETAGLVTISYDTGVIAAIDCSWSRPATAATWGGVKMSVGGTAGSVDIDFFGPRVAGLDTVSGLPLELPYGPNFDESLLATFLASVRSGIPAQPDGDVGLRTLRIVLAAQESARTGSTITLP